MSLFDKVKNLFTEEIEEEPIIKKEVRHIELEAPKKVEKTKFDEEIEEKKEEKREDKFVFFSDDDFKDLEKTNYSDDEEFEKPSYYRKKEEVPERPVYQRRELNTTYSRKKEPTVTKVEVREDKKFKPSLIISPVYGVLDKNYSKEEIVHKNKVAYKNPESLSVDDIRNKAYGTLEDELKDALLGKREEVSLKEINDIDIFEELDKCDEEVTENSKTMDKDIDKDIIDVDDLFDSLDNKKEEILDELDTKKEEILDELDNKKDYIIINDDEETEEDESLNLKKEIEKQKKKLAEINDILDDDKDEDDLNESELFDLIDSIYEKKDDE